MREQARKHRKVMRCSDLWRKPREIRRNDVSARKSSNNLWQAGGKAKFVYRPPGYGEDPAMLRQTAAAVTYQGQAIDKVVAFKSSLIDLETYVYEAIAA